LCDALARPWTDFYSAPEIRPDWYEHSGSLTELESSAVAHEHVA
jgi:hypothetical protein